jgi:hypothetical protein
MGACSQCELDYCSRCRDVDWQRASDVSHCRACGAVGHAGYAQKGWLTPLTSWPNIGRYEHWHGIENDRYRYLLGRGLLGDLLVVTDFEGHIVKVKEIGFWRKLFGWMG